jgi:hypothetical protein
MNIHHYLVDVVIYGIGYGSMAVSAVFLAFRSRIWVRKAHKLAADSDIVLPGPLTGRVARFLRDEFLFFALVAWLFVCLAIEMLTVDWGRRQWAQWFPWLLAGLPVFCVCFCYASTVWPRWRASGAGRVTHLGHVPVRRAFTPAEGAVAVTGAVFAAVTGGWGLWLVAAPAWWWAVCAAAFTAGVAAWWRAVSAIMGRPSSASDEIELGWDDLFRFRHVRGLTVAAAWIPAVFIFLADDQLLAYKFISSYIPVLVPFYVPIALSLMQLVFSAFRQGRQLWRRAWGHRAECTDGSAASS